MPAISNKQFNIIEWSKFYHRGKVLPEIEMLAQHNYSVMDMPFMQANDGTTHLYNLQTALPAVGRTSYGKGSPESKSQKVQEREMCTMLTGFSSVEEDMTKVGGGQGAIRAREDAAFAEALRQLWASMQFYGNRGTDIEDVNGFATRYNALGGVKTKHVISCAGATLNAQTSAYLINWGPDVYGIFPEGTTAGYTKQNLGRQVRTLANGNRIVNLETKHLWHVGIVVEAWPSVVRVCNIDTASLLAMSGTQAVTAATNVMHSMIRAQKRIRRPGRKVWYVNEEVQTYLMRYGLEKSSGAVKVQEAVTQFGTFEETRLYGVPVRTVDRILLTEAVVV